MYIMGAVLHAAYATAHDVRKMHSNMQRIVMAICTVRKRYTLCDAQHMKHNASDTTQYTPNNHRNRHTTHKTKPTKHGTQHTSCSQLVQTTQHTPPETEHKVCKRLAHMMQNVTRNVVQHSNQLKHAIYNTDNI